MQQGNDVFAIHNPSPDSPVGITPFASAERTGWGPAHSSNGDDAYCLSVYWGKRSGEPVLAAASSSRLSRPIELRAGCPAFRFLRPFIPRNRLTGHQSESFSSGDDRPAGSRSGAGLGERTRRREIPIPPRWLRPAASNAACAAPRYRRPPLGCLA